MQFSPDSRPQLIVPDSSAAGFLHCIAVLALAAAFVISAAAQAPRGPRVLPPGPMIDGGEITLSSPDLSVTVLKYSGTVARLSPKEDSTIDYTPGDRLKERSADTFYYLGDLDLRIRRAGAVEWTDIS